MNTAAYTLSSFPSILAHNIKSPWKKPHMRVLDKAIFIEAHSANFSAATRASSAVKYIVCHYTGNINDTARNNALYFRSNPIQTSAHFFVSEDTVYQSVRENHVAYAVGLGSRKQPYYKWPSMWKKITNSNSISVEICGSKNSREGSVNTKDTAAKLVADLLEKYNLTPSCVFRHYDVTGKNCPAWAVDDPLKWLDFTIRVNNYFYGKGGDEMTDTPENYELFKKWMTRYLNEREDSTATWANGAMQYAADRQLILEGRPNSWVTRGELATVLLRMNA